ncbi:MAG: DedA family protein [Alphaproteobacteria bacterium]
MFERLGDMIEAIGQLGIFLLMLLENVFPPIPSELIMPLAGYLAAQGEMGFTAAVISGSAGASLGAFLWYYIGWKLGLERLQRWAARHGRWAALSPQDIDKANDWFKRHGRAAVFFGRLVPGIRTYISVPAGIAQMPFASFALYTVIGTVFWSTFLCACGYWLGQNYALVGEWLDPVSYIVIAAIIGTYLYRVATFNKRHERGKIGQSQEIREH